MDSKKVTPNEFDCDTFTAAQQQSSEAVRPSSPLSERPREIAKMTAGGGAELPQQDSLLTAPYAEDKRAYMKLINDVRATGVSAHVDLPTICVIGNQSSGKSSLIEAVSGINLPRAANTCTRCPTEVRLQETPDAAWQCKIKLRREVDENGNPWNGDKEVAFGSLINDPSMVEPAIRRAQLAILNPSVEYNRFVDYEIPKEADKLPLGSKRQLSFSENVVCLEISGPQVIDLTLIDLPGIIKNVGEGEDPDSIAIIEDLVCTYIEKDCLILLTITMTDDFNNQSAVMLAKDCDPEGRRTIGVLTKADRVAVADCATWIKMLKGERERLRHGYYVTRQPGTEELEAKISFEEARKKESIFFQTSEPWKTLDSVSRSRLGTKHLTSFLSNQLTAFIKQRLPTLVRNIKDTTLETEQALRAMPARPSDDPSGEMLRLVTDFQDEVTGYTNGAYLHKTMVQQLHAIYAEFKCQIRSTTPLYTPFTSAEIKNDKQHGKGHDYMTLLKDPTIEQADMSESETARWVQKQASAAKKRHVLTLDEVRDQIESAVTWELPGNVPWDVKLEQITRVTEPWKAITFDIFEKIKPVVSSILEELVTQIFGRYEETLLAVTVQSCVDEELAKLAESTALALEQAVTLDTQPYTQNVHYLMNVCEKIFAALNERRCPPVASTQIYQHSQIVSQALSSLAQLGYRVKEEDLKKLNAPSEWEREIRVMAEIRAYFQVAYKRIIDVVPSTITAKFIKPLSMTIYRALLEHLAIATPEGRERCRAYLCETEDVSARRSQLEEQIRNLKAANEAVHRFERPISK